MRRFALGIAAISMLVVGCATDAVRLDQLPEESIAFRFWDSEAARRRAEILGRIGTPDSERRVGIARLDRGPQFENQAGITSALARFPGRLTLMNPRTLELTPVTAAPRGARPFAWSADHRRLLLSGALGEKTSQIYEYDVASGEVRAVTHSGRSHSEASYGGDGRVAFFAWEPRAGGRHSAVYTTAPNRGSEYPLFEGGIVEDLQWLPNGQQVVYTSVSPQRRADQHPLRHILIRDLVADATGRLSTGEARSLTRGRSPVVTRDSEWIVYSAPVRDGGWRLRRMRVNGSSRTALGNETLRDESDPAVSPDGRYVAYAGDDEGIQRLFIRRFDGSGDRILLTHGAVDSLVW